MLPPGLFLEVLGRRLFFLRLWGQSRDTDTRSDWSVSEQGQFYDPCKNVTESLSGLQKLSRNFGVPISALCFGV